MNPCLFCCIQGANDFVAFQLQGETGRTLPWFPFWGMQALEIGIPPSLRKFIWSILQDPLSQRMLRSSRTPWPQRRSEGHHPGVNAGSLDGPLPLWGKGVLREHQGLSLAGSILCLPRHNPRTSQGMLWKSGRLCGKRSASSHDCLQANFQTFGFQLCTSFVKQSGWQIISTWTLVTPWLYWIFGLLGYEQMESRKTTFKYLLWYKMLKPFSSTLCWLSYLPWETLEESVIWQTQRRWGDASSVPNSSRIKLFQSDFPLQCRI